MPGAHHRMHVRLSTCLPTCWSACMCLLCAARPLLCGLELPNLQINLCVKGSVYRSAPAVTTRHRQGPKYGQLDTTVTSAPYFMGRGCTEAFCGDVHLTAEQRPGQHRLTEGWAHSSAAPTPPRPRP